MRNGIEEQKQRLRSLILYFDTQPFQFASTNCRFIPRNTEYDWPVCMSSHPSGIISQTYIVNVTNFTGVVSVIHRLSVVQSMKWVFSRTYWSTLSRLSDVLLRDEYFTMLSVSELTHNLSALAAEFYASLRICCVI